jgi:hypothetical protein
VTSRATLRVYLIQIAILRRKVTGVSFVSANRGKYETYQRVPPNNDGCSVTTVQRATQDQLKTIKIGIETARNL